MTDHDDSIDRFEIIIYVLLAIIIAASIVVLK